MSRIGKIPVKISENIAVTITGSLITIKKDKIERKLETYNRVILEQKDNQLHFIRKDLTKESSAFLGTYRALFANIILGLDKGFKKSLEINGVGYRANVSSRILNLQLGYSHPIAYNIPENIDIKVEKNLISISGIDKQVVGQTAAEIRSFRKPEPYKGKGIKYSDEVIIRKSGKTSGK